MQSIERVNFWTLLILFPFALALGAMWSMFLALFWILGYIYGLVQGSEE